MSISQLVSPTRSLKYGDSGPAVTAAQLAMKQMGYQLGGSGWFGPGTDVAVRTVQKRAGLHVDGQIGPDTAKVIDAATITQKSVGQAPAPAPNAPHPQEVSRPLWLEAGIQLIGVKREASGRFAEGHSNPVIIDWAKEEGGEIAKEYTSDTIAWCALFANYCLTKVGLPGTETLWALDFAGHWPSIKLSGPAVGAFAPMTRPGGGHIVQIVGRNAAGLPMCLGGNQGDQVSIEAFSRSRLNQGFWWPKSVPVPKQIGYDQLPIVSSTGKVVTK